MGFKLLFKMDPKSLNSGMSPRALAYCCEIDSVGCVGCAAAFGFSAEMVGTGVISVRVRRVWASDSSLLMTGIAPRSKGSENFSDEMYRTRECSSAGKEYMESDLACKTGDDYHS